MLGVERSFRSGLKLELPLGSWAVLYSPGGLFNSQKQSISLKKTPSFSYTKKSLLENAEVKCWGWCYLGRVPPGSICQPRCCLSGPSPNLLGQSQLPWGFGTFLLPEPCKHQALQTRGSSAGAAGAFLRVQREHSCGMQGAGPQRLLAVRHRPTNLAVPCKTGLILVKAKRLQKVSMVLGSVLRGL